MDKLRILDLFSGIGGFSLGLERTGGFETVAFCEIDPFCRKVLAKHWPGVPIYKDIEKCFPRTSLQQVSRARMQVTPAPNGVSAPELPEPVQDFSGRSCRPFAWYDQSALCWRTWQRCFIEAEGWEEFLGPWPRSGMTRNGIAYQCQPLAPLIGEIASALLPTIGANESKGSQKLRYRGSPAYRGAKMSEGLRTCPSDPIYTHPNFAEASMDFPKDWTLVETPSSPGSQKDMDTPSLKRKD